jgi:glycosyltransferase involved in cell wall biosynthesis
MSLVIHAPNVHVGGGLVLLAAILDALDGSVPVSLLLHKRLSVPKRFPENISVCRINPTLLSRFWCEWRLRGMVSSGDIVLCFGNLPPLFKLRGKVFLFVQNRYLIEKRSLSGFPISARIRILIERFWFAWKKKNVNHILVQTPSMQRSIMTVWGEASSVLPFSRDSSGYERANSGKLAGKVLYDFLYVASGEPHKNHRNLVEAWILLSEEGIRPKLVLTLEESKFPDLCVWIETRKRNCNLNIENRGNIAREDLQELYYQTNALIYPSDFESLGLPLIEARSAGLSILASERDYVRDMVDPEETFDPNSPVSIARAVKRFLRIPERSLPVMNARDYLAKLCEMAQA